MALRSDDEQRPRAIGPRATTRASERDVGRVIEDHDAGRVDPGETARKAPL
jgi:hypothetical protein